jgi:anti-sigma factor RsiW
MTPTELAPSCSRVRDRLERLLDHALDPLEEARDRGHLEACAACAAEERALVRLLAGVRAASAPLTAELEDALGRVDARLATEPAVACGARRRGLRILRSRALVPVATVAAAVLLLLVLETTGYGIGTLMEATAPPTLPTLELALPQGIDLLGGVR